MRTRLTITLLAFCGACTEMTDYYPNAKTVEIEGRTFYVAERPQNGPGVYLAGPNDPKLFEAVYSADISLPGLNVRAIEEATGCGVARETVRNIESGVTFAQVRC